ncbi:hypothetical protein AVV36_gp286 [Pectobacterium bacteriophage PM2]|uniref:Uncharacterized protein n=1 Tax=Pectobacterium bacteriophage PM2 TaxID=1429794 RepID=A0A0A0PZI8_9CAUD|nr:hypothetical protein AVV36_gp286 [Pectobacterium bacteriophage PM2]AHY25124.1 hypothetical protein PM2_162 [Pectobacterium bacteriophage PM2]
MMTFNEFLMESSNSVIKDKEGSLEFGLMKNADGVYFQIGTERFQSGKATKDAILAVLTGDGRWQGGGAAGGKRAGIAVDRKEKMAYFKIGDESFILGKAAYKQLLDMFK